MGLNKKNFDAVIVVEGKDDTIRLKQFFPGIETIETNGSAVSDEVLKQIQKLSESRQIIVFTDPDFNGERIRRIVTKAVPDAKQAFITRKEGEPHKKGSLGVEHASKEALEHALSDLHEVEPQKSDLTPAIYRQLGLAGGSGSRKLREQVGIKLRVGYGNSKQFYNRLHTFGVSLAELKAAVKEVENDRYFVKAKKNLGQNFLVDQTAILGIVEAAGIKKDDQVIEIGPGIGSLTEQLLLAGAKVFAYEVDDSLPTILQNELPKKIDDQPLASRFKILLKDVLKANFKEDIGDFFDFTKPIKVVANLPYYITTPIIFALAESDLHFTSLTLMMQKEVAERLEAQPGSKDYGPLTISVQTEMKVKLALQVGRNSFMPRPKVDSSVVVLTPLKEKPAIEDRKHFIWVVKMCFSQRRKTLNNNLKSLLPDKTKRDELITELGVDPRIRPEDLTIEQFIKIAKFIPAK